MTLFGAEHVNILANFARQSGQEVCELPGLLLLPCNFACATFAARRKEEVPGLVFKPQICFYFFLNLKTQAPGSSWGPVQIKGNPSSRFMCSECFSWKHAAVLRTKNYFSSRIPQAPIAFGACSSRSGSAWLIYFLSHSRLQENRDTLSQEQNPSAFQGSEECPAGKFLFPSWAGAELQHSPLWSCAFALCLILPLLALVQIRNCTIINPGL